MNLESAIQMASIDLPIHADKTMSISNFLEDLEKHGRVKVPDGHEPNDVERAAMRSFLLARDREVRMNFPQGAPELNEAACEWAALQLYRACQFLVCRDVSADIIEEILEKDYDEVEIDASIIYSVDLYFVYLKDLIDMAAGISEDDQLVKSLIVLAEKWPFSAVGIDCKQNGSIETIFADSCLKQVYLERIIKHNDFNCIENQDVLDAVKSSLGAYPMLSGLCQ